jgi:hypothetical protein
MCLRNREPRLEDILADSIVRAVMEADCVDPLELETELRRTAALLRATRRTPKSREPWDAGRVGSTSQYRGRNG